MKILKTLIISMLLTTPVMAKVKTDSASIKSGKVHEVCMDLEFGQRLHYSFMSSRDLKFNIHFHDGEKVSYPVKSYSTSKADTIFTSQNDQGYCMMWTNVSNRTVKLNVVYNVR